MSTKKRTFLAILAGLGWGGAATIADNGATIALLGMGAMALTMSLWLDHDTAYRLGIRAGINIARIKARAELRNYTPDLYAGQIINGQRQQGAPPIVWPR